MPQSKHPKRELANKLLSNQERKTGQGLFKSNAWLNRKHHQEVSNKVEEQAEAQYKAAYVREKQTSVGFWKGMKYLLIMAKLKLKESIRQVFSIFKSEPKPISTTSERKREYSFPRNPRHYLNGLTMKNRYTHA